MKFLQKMFHAGCSECEKKDTQIEGLKNLRDSLYAQVERESSYYKAMRVANDILHKILVFRKVAPYNFNILAFFSEEAKIPSSEIDIYKKYGEFKGNFIYFKFSESDEKLTK
jgi:hypothetical protein